MKPSSFLLIVKVVFVGVSSTVFLVSTMHNFPKYASLTGQSLTGVVGSPAYVAPEVLAGNYSEKVDVWGAGVLLHALLVGELPFQGDSLDSVFEAVKKVKLDFCSGVWESVSQLARDLIAHMLTRDVSSRLTADQVLSKLQYSFLFLFRPFVFPFVINDD